MFHETIKQLDERLWSRHPPQKLTLLGAVRAKAVRRLQRRTGLSMLVLRGKWRETVRGYVAALRPEDRAEPTEVLFRYISLLLYCVWQNEEVPTRRLDRWLLVEWQTLLIDSADAERHARRYPSV